VKYLKTLVVALGVTLWLPMAAQSADTSAEPAEKPAQPAEGSATPAKCLEAAVNPVTGFAVCVNPRGAQVIVAQALLGFLVQGKDAARIGQEDLALLGQLNAARIAHNQARADLIFETFDVKTHRRLGEIDLPRRLGKAAGVADGYEGS